MRQNRFAIRGWPSTPHYFEKDALDLLQEKAEQYDWSKASGAADLSSDYVERKTEAIGRVEGENPNAMYQRFARKAKREGRKSTQLLLIPIMRGRPGGVSIF